MAAVLRVFIVTSALAGQVIMAANTQTSDLDGIVPDIIDAPPDGRISVIYPGSKEVAFGNELAPLEVKEQPQVNWNSEEDSYYTLMMVDPDAPSRDNPLYREIKHWLVGNVLGSKVEKGDVIAEYVGSGPPKGTGLHRYVFLIYRQPGIIDYSEEPKTPWNSRKDRKNFSARKFAKEYNLGPPVAVNFYKAQWDSYVETRNKDIQ